MALPALHALSAVAAHLVIAAPPWGADLYREVRGNVVPLGAFPRGDVAVLFPPSFRAAWEARHSPRRIGIASDFRQWLLTDVVKEHEHRGETYAALAAAVGAVAEGPPRWRTDSVPSDAPEGHIGLNPISRSGGVVDWQGYAVLAERIGRPVVFYGGPGEEARVARVAGRHLQKVGLSLPEFARSLARCALFVSNDSGAAHFSRACGVPTLVIYGSTAPERTGPAGAASVQGKSPCRPCYRKSCRFDFECLHIPVDAVARAIGQIVK